MSDRALLVFGSKAATKLPRGLAHPSNLLTSCLFPVSPSEHRCVESAKIRNKYPDRVPVSGRRAGAGVGWEVKGPDRVSDLLSEWR